MASSLSGTRAIALSYGNMIRPIPTAYHEPAFKLSSKIINHLIGKWGPYENTLLYSVNVPMVDKLLDEDGMKIYWTTVWRCGYGRLFNQFSGPADGGASVKVEENTVQVTDAAVPREAAGTPRDSAEGGNLVFEFKPDLTELLSQTAAPEGTDGWAINVGAVSVTPYLTSYAELPESERGFSCIEDREWKL